MFELELERKIRDFRELGLPRYFRRDGQVPLVENTVTTILGARRAGKSYRALQIADELIRKGLVPGLDHICLIDFDNPILSAIKAPALKLIQSTFLKITPQASLKTPLVFILDEIHRIEGWEEYAIDLSRNPQWKVIVTGSSSRLMKRDIATSLRGKAVSAVVYPLSFAEYLRFNEVDATLGSTKGEAEIRRLFDEYLRWGGYPALARLDRQTRETLLREYFDTMILRDMVERFNISKPRQCIRICQYWLSNAAKPITLKSGYEYLKQAGYPTSRDAVRDYMSWGEDCWLFFTVPIYSHSRKEEERNYRKVYCIDWALAIRNSTVWDGSYSRALENMIFLHLLRMFSRVRYSLTSRTRREVDFLACDEQGKPALAAQVCMDISTPETLRRELEPLISTARHFGTKENLIVTSNEERRFDEQGVTVHAVPAWRFLLTGCP